MIALIHTHSLLAWLLLVLLLLSVILGIVKSTGSGRFRNPLKLLFLFTMILAHLQVVLGVVLYFSSPKVVFSELTMSEALFRFFTLEHPLIMIIAAILITIGYSRAKKATTSKKAFKSIYIYYLIGFALILLRFPWKYLSGIGAGWFT